MFSHLSVMLFMGEGVVLYPTFSGTRATWDQTSSERTWDQTGSDIIPPKPEEVCILLECFLFFISRHESIRSIVRVGRKICRRCRKLLQQERGNGTDAISYMNSTFSEQPSLGLEPPLSKIAPSPPDHITGFLQNLTVFLNYFRKSSQML